VRRGAFALCGWLSLVVAFGASCSRKPESPARTSATTPGPVTLRFANQTPGDVFLDVTYGEALDVVDGAGRSLERQEFCGTDCETCNRRVCGSPLHVVRKIAKGSTWETKWSGDFYESGKGDKDCTCQRRRLAEDGRYTITLKGRSAAQSLGAAVGNDPNVLGGTVDPTSSDCVGTGVVTLGVAPSTADIAWSCR
jgi:hypothetical protein